MRHSKYSIVVVGSGISGLYTALKLAQNLGKDDEVLLVTKSNLEDSNSYYAQGGMVAVLDNNVDDSVDLHVSDTLVAGAGLSEEETVKFISSNSNEVVKDLLTFGVEFDRDENGDFKLTKEAAHSVRRILHSGGDATGREMEKALCNAVRNSEKIKILEKTMAIDLIIENNECRGVVVYNSNGYEAIYSSAVILATGGVGQLYKYTTNPIGATGDGIALAYRAGAVLQDMEFVQFHPTALAFDDIENHNRFLISEAVRGEGAKLCDKNGVEFMEKYDSRKELAPRDIVARSIFKQMQDTNEPNVYLNATVIGKDKLLQRFPTIAKKCAHYKIDITRDLIPIAPVAHYFMGGIKTNLKSETSIKNLYAVGETASTGLHGANRLASNSLLECVVCAYECAKSIRVSDVDVGFTVLTDNKIKTSCDVEKLKQKLKNTMWENVGIFRTKETLEKALKDIEKIQNDFGKFDVCASMHEYELRNMLTVASLIVISAINRQESRGAHYRLDYLNTETEAKHSKIMNKLKV